MRSPGPTALRALREIAVAELAVREPVAERVKRRDRQIVITHRVLGEIRIGGSARGIRGVVERHRARGARECRGQSAGRRILAKQHVGHGIAGLPRPASRFRGWPAPSRRAPESRAGDRSRARTTTGLPVASTRRASSQLARRQFEARAAARLARHVEVFADHEHGDVGGSSRASPPREYPSDRRCADPRPAPTASSASSARRP